MSKELNQYGMDALVNKVQQIQAKSKDIEEVKKDIDSYIPKKAILINTKKPIEETFREVLSKII